MNNDQAVVFGGADNAENVVCRRLSDALAVLVLAFLAGAKQKFCFWVYEQSIVYWFTCSRAPTDRLGLQQPSRPETQDWVYECRSQHVSIHRQALFGTVVRRWASAFPPYASTTLTDAQWADIVEVIPPEGRFGSTDSSVELNPMLLKRKAILNTFGKDGHSFAH